MGAIQIVADHQFASDGLQVVIQDNDMIAVPANATANV